MQATKYAFTARGREYKFNSREDYQKAFSNYLIVDSRREHGREITEEMLLEPGIQELYNRELQSSTEEK